MTDHAERPEDHLAGLRPVRVQAGAVRAALLLLEEVEAQPGQDARMRSNARDVHEALAPSLAEPVAGLVAVADPVVGPAVVLPGQAVSVGSAVQISVRVPAGLKKAVKLACLARRMQVQEGVKAALEHWLNTVEPHPEDVYWRGRLPLLPEEPSPEDTEEL